MKSAFRIQNAPLGACFSRDTQRHCGIGYGEGARKVAKLASVVGHGIMDPFSLTRLSRDVSFFVPPYPRRKLLNAC
jgi:hypothetical protein